MSPEEWAFKIGELIKEAEADGYILSWNEGLDALMLVSFGAYFHLGKWWVNGSEVSDPIAIDW